MSGLEPVRSRRRPGPPDGDPSVFAADEQSAAPVDVAHLVRLTEAVLAAEGVRGACELSLYFVDETAMAEVNERFMGASGPTDVLAFPIDDDLVDPGRSPDAGSTGPDRAPMDPSEIPVLLGDVLVCPAVAARNAAERADARAAGTEPDPSDTPNGATELADELALLVVHGTLHVLGMDHADRDEAAAMQARERDLLDRLHRKSAP
ncbi:MAG: rRNA maturation RNase YbeY [Acidimicrobiales bacterium]